MRSLLLISSFILLVHSSDGHIWCYSCMSSQPGCEEHSVSWLIHGAVTCSKANDVCVKIVEKQGADVQVTRDCLSNLIGFRKDIPADRYEGCRSAAKQPRAAVDVDNTMTQLDLRRTYWTNTTYCFCEFDEWCNSSSSLNPNQLILSLLLLISPIMPLIFLLL